jgi:hypothetical protein
VFVWTETGSEDVDTVIVFPVEAVAGFVTPGTVIRTVSPPAMVPHPLGVKTALSGPRRVWRDKPHVVPVVTSSAENEALVKSVPDGPVRVIVENSDDSAPVEDVVNETVYVASVAPAAVVERLTDGAATDWAVVMA